ncbi:MAG: hypothetical protein IKL48_01325 [Elusimicrobiaceae bacterium]|nr:hypothetical protein [Elusimicrobiaceae bacterium]
MSEKIQGWVYVLSILGAVLFWFFTMYGLPPRVDKLEARVQQHEDQLARQDVKMDIVIDDVKTIKSILMQFRRSN